MSDFRVNYLRVLEYHPHSLSLVQTLALSALYLAAFVLELRAPSNSDSVCVTKIRPWLIGAFARNWVRLMCSVGASVARVARAIQSLKSAVEVLDVMGVVWFALLLIAVIPSTECMGRTPLMYISCLAYIGSMFLYVLCYWVVVTSLRYYPPVSAADREYLMERRARYSRDSDNSSSPLMDGGDREFWKSWLEKYGSFEFVYNGCNLRSDHRNSNFTQPSKGKGKYAFGSRASRGDSTAETMSQSADGTDFADSVSFDIEMGEGHFSNGNAFIAAACEEEESTSDICAICLLPFEARQVANPLNCRFSGQQPFHPHSRHSYNLSKSKHHLLSISEREEGEEKGERNLEEVTLVESHDCTGNVRCDSENACTEGVCSNCNSAKMTLVATIQSLSEEKCVAEQEELQEQQEQQEKREPMPVQVVQVEESVEGAEGTALRGDERRSSEGEQNSIIVRYPCPGSHFFHAHCLHEWLRVNSAGLHERQGRLAGLVGDYRDKVTCPVCREKPSVNINAFKRTHFV